MIQKESYLHVIDNSGAKIFNCIYVGKGYRRRYAELGDIVLGSIKTLRTKRKSTVKIKKGAIVNALIVRTKVYRKSFVGDSYKFFTNAVVLLNKQNKLIGTRIFGGLHSSFRHTRFFKLIFLSAGNVK